MKHTAFFPAEARAARHSPALFTDGSRRIDIGPAAMAMTKQISQLLRPLVAELAGDPQLTLRTLPMDNATPDTLPGLLPGPAGLSLHDCAGDTCPALFAIDGRIVLTSLDRAFGGDGLIGDDLPESLPHSAALLAQRSSGQMMAIIARELRLGDMISRTPDGPDFLDMLPDGTPMQVITWEATGTIMPGARLVLAIGADLLASSLHRHARPNGVQASWQDTPMADLPLPSTARLVDMNVPVRRIAALEPGAVLPIRVARNIPLQVGEVVLAHGTAGEVDDQIALQITQTALKKVSP